MPQTVLVEKPVILSKHKRNVIAHGKPLGPIGSFYLPRPVLKDSYIQEKHGDTTSIKSPLQVRSESFSEYQKSAQNNLISINNNLSSMLQETFSGIDSICQKVRMCLMESNTTKTPDLSRMGTCEQLNIPEEETHADEVPSIEQVEPDQIDGELIDEIVEDVAEEHEEEMNENETAQENLTQTLKNLPNITPFVTILNPKNLSAESIGITLINSNPSKLGISRKCSVENIQTTIKQAKNQLANYEKLLRKYGGEIKGRRSQMMKRPKTSPSERSRTSEHQLGQDFKKPDFNEDPLSESDLCGNDSTFKFNRKKPFGLLASGRADYLCVDVYRKRAIMDLHRRMVAQVEANDSLIFFQRLMAKNKKHIEESKPATANESCTDRTTFKSPMQSIQPQKYQGEKRRRSLSDLSKKYKDSLWFKHKPEPKRARKEQKKSTTKRPSKKEKCLPQSYTIQGTINPRGKLLQRKKSSKESVRSSCKCKISVTNNQPLSSSDKCRLHWMRAKYSQLSHKKLKYLDILDDISSKDLLPIRAEYPRRDGIVRISDVKDSYLYKLMHGKDTNKAWTDLLKPSKDCTNNNVHKKSGEDDPNQPGGNDGDNKAENVQSNADRQKVIRTLSKYIFAEVTPPQIENNVFTVMPVHVSYDNPRLTNTTRKTDVLTPTKLPLLPMKECKEPKKAEWTTDNAKKSKPTKVVYDPILKKIEKEIKMVGTRRENKSGTPKPAETNSWSPKNKIPQKQQPNVPGGSGRTVVVSELFKRSPKSSPDDTNRPLWNSACIDPINYQKELQLKNKIQKDLDAQSARLKSDNERKLWGNKYGKSVGQKLLNFIEKQPTVYQIPIPKYALPRPPKESKGVAKQEQMLLQLRTLKQKNDNIQTNIQKAIDVIEDKMVDILCKPNTSESIEAFDQMEKEITNVLSMMKTTCSSHGVSRQIENLAKINEDDDVDKISEELFNKLNKILTSPDAASSGKSSKISLTRGKLKKKNTRQKPESPDTSSEMNQISMSSTSASGEEKFTITAISPRRSPKKSSVKKIRKLDNINDQELISIGSEIRKLRNELNEEFQTKSDKAKDNVTSVLIKKTKVIPVQEQVINLALVDDIRGCSAGEPIREASTSTETNQEPTITDRGEQPVNVDEPSTENSNCSEIKVCSEPKLVEEMTINYQEAMVNEEQLDVVEITGPYYTPETTPLTGIRPLKEGQDAAIAVENSGDENENVSKEIKQDLIEEPPYKAAHEGCPDTQDAEESEASLNEKQALENSTGDDNSSKNKDLNCFYDNVNKIISRVETVYTQLEQFEEELRSEESPVEIAVFREPPRNPEPESDAFLTPFMHAVKDIRKSAAEVQKSRPASPRMYRSPSYFNVLSFLDSLADFKEERAVEVYTSRVLNFAHLCLIPTLYHQSTIQEQCTYLTTDPIEDVPKKRSGCLKNPSSHLNMTTSMSKSKQKVSFFFEKEEKATQVTPCLYHSAAKILSDHQVNSENSTYSSSKDEEVSTIPSASSESKSVENVSSNDDESTSYQSTFEFSSDQLSSDKVKMPESHVENILASLKAQENENKKNVVEIFRNSNAEEKSKDKVKVFHDHYQKDNNSKLISGSYNETSILQVEESLHKDFAIKKRDSLEKLIKNPDEALLKQLLQESNLLEPIKDLQQFVDSKLLKEIIEQRQRIRMMRRRSSTSLGCDKNEEMKIIRETERDRQNFLKGIYVFVYLLMFTALNLEYKCVH